jgi:hypothetical protein
MDHEGSVFTTRDQFFREGLKILEQERQELASRGDKEAEIDDNDDDNDELAQGKLKREHLKGVLFDHLNEGND